MFLQVTVGTNFYLFYIALCNFFIFENHDSETFSVSCFLKLRFYSGIRIFSFSYALNHFIVCKYIWKFMDNPVLQGETFAEVEERIKALVLPFSVCSIFSKMNDKRKKIETLFLGKGPIGAL